MIKRIAVACSLAAIFLALTLATTPAMAQTGTGEIHGTVTDPSGALVQAGAVVLSSPDGAKKTATTGRDGAYKFAGLAPGSYQLSISAPGFSPATVENITVAASRAVLENITLQIAVAEQQVEVTEDAVTISTESDNNASSIVIKGKDLNALSDDPDELQSELTALAGPAAGPNGAQIFIDGFTGGTLPPKSSIREIRVNQNPFSAQYDKLGYGRIEILTKPGTDKLHGNLMMMGNDNAFNSLNPFVKSEPAYHTMSAMGGVGGSLNSRTSWYASTFYRDNAANAIINAPDIDTTTGQTYYYSAAVASPQSRLDFSPRFDFQIGAKNTLTVRYSLDRQTTTNGGISTNTLPAQGFNQSGWDNSVQLSDSQVISSTTVNETRFSYRRSISTQTPLSTAPSIMVQGGFMGGGNGAGAMHDHQDNLELDNYTTVAAKAHAIQYGLRLRYYRDANYSNAGFNGSYTYSSLQQYAAGTPSQYSVTTGNPKALVSMYDLGLFFQDDYKYSTNLTLSYGLRYETQNQIDDHNDWAPRFSLAWAPGGSKTKTVIRAGYGWFFDRFGSNNVLQTIRQNGVNQQTSITTYSPSGVATSVPTPSIYQIAPNLRASLNMQAAAGIEHQFGKIATVSATYINSRGVHQYLSDNVNAYENGTYNPATQTGIRPNGINENIYQFQSGGLYKQNQLMVNYSVQAKRVSIFGFYALTFANADTSGANYFPSNQYDPMADWGRANFDVRNRLMFGGNITGPYGITFNPMFDYNSGSPFNITLSDDLNGDNKFNDRPAYATSSTPAANQVATSYGTFDVNPAWNAARIPYNVGTGPSSIGLNMRISKSFGVGPKLVKSAQGANSGGQGGPPGGGPGGPGGPPPGGGGGMPGGGLGPGGLSGSGGGMFRSNQQAIARRYSLTFTAMGRNVMNNVNLANPMSSLPSLSAVQSNYANSLPALHNSSFGQSNSIAGGMFGSASSNREIDLQVMFNF
jgi:hypothetical protein